MTHPPKASRTYRPGGVGRRGMVRLDGTARFSARWTGRRRAKRSRRWWFGAVLSALVLATVPAAAAAQSGRSLPDSIVQLDLEYRRDLRSYEAAVASEDVIRREWERLFQLLRSAEGEREDSLSGEFHVKSGELRAQRRRVEERQQELEASRRALLDALYARREELEAQIDRAVTEGRRNDLTALRTDVLIRAAELQEAASEVVLPRFALRNLVDLDDRNTPEEVRAKLGLVERQIAHVDSTSAEWGREIEQLEARLDDRDRQRARADFRAAVDRFDDIRPPVGGPPRERPPEAPQEGADQPLTLEERIAQLKQSRETLAEVRAQLVARAEKFRAYLRKIT